ncbi:MBL fold metallo-hydrolase [Hymenobacter sp. GOD-10R]|uniref:MBL fold metallo-hydrolase n=1 Tax=Hymenobacter sp. GOD-10R TaxID=3093922 RepID=UPI002D7748CA|nr:MBL fold metallo-hydrolase [Hymenobacter sp. GOD-10R]WRQ30305.1 MBL fold metallo-hydrolase [Hymenobacter sp. GOD-10R]
MRRSFQHFFMTTGGLVGTVLLAAVAFLFLSPELGGKPTKDERLAFAQKGHYRDGEFQNLQPTQVMTGGSTVGVLWKFLTQTVPDAEPTGPLPWQPLDSLTITRKTPELVRVTWFGHSASLVEIAGQNLLLDPMLSIGMGPVRWATPKRYNPELAIRPEQLPPLAAVLISHDHYDHLDYQTVQKIKDKVGLFCVPLGIGAHLRAWGVVPKHIREVSWGDSVRLPGLTLISTPSRHFSGRGLGNRNSTLWTSWVVRASRTRLFYTGDGGYGTHFAEIGRQYGPFDLALVECGQYDDDWAEIHMKPEQSVQAALDVRARVMLPVHWGAFTEARHAWNESVRRATAAATAHPNLQLTTPYLGQPVVLGAPLPQKRWWEGPLQKRHE